jgi:hypothetical protein
VTDHPCEALSALVDGELPAAESAAVEAHLLACPVCRALKEDVMRLDQALAAETPPPVPADLAARIRGRLEARAPRRRPAWWSVRLAATMPAAAAAAVVVAALGWMAWRGARPPGAIPTEEVAAHAPGAAPAASGAPAATGEGAADAPATAPPPLPSAAGRAPERTSAPASPPAPAEVARQNLEPKSRPPEASADAGAEPGSPPPAVLPHAADRAWSRADAGAVGQETSGEAGREAAPSAEPFTEQPLLRAAAPPESRPAPAEARPAFVAAPVAPPRLEASPYIVRLEADDSMNVRVDDYTCTVPITPEDARLLSVIGDAATAPTAAGMKTARKRDVGAAQSAVPPPTAASGSPAAEVKPGAPGGSSGAIAPPPEPAPLVLPAAARQAVVHMVRERYRPIIEQRCGPLPR